MFCEFRGRFNCCHAGHWGSRYFIFPRNKGTTVLGFWGKTLQRKAFANATGTAAVPKKESLPGFDHLPKMMRIPASFLRGSDQNPPKPPKKRNLCYIPIIYPIYGDVVGAFFFWGGFKKDMFPFRRPGPESSTLARACNEVWVSVWFSCWNRVITRCLGKKGWINYPPGN